MQADQKPVIWTIVIASLLMVAAISIGSVAVGNIVGDGLDKMNTQLKGLDVDEQAIVNGVIGGIIMPTMPEWTEPEMPNSDRINELWTAEYSDEVDALEGNATEVAITEFMDDNDNFADNGSGVWFFFEDDEIYDLVTEGVDCDGDCVVEYVKEYEDDREVTVINLGLDDEDDREVTLYTRIRVKIYTDEDDLDEYEFERVDINSVVTSDDGDLEAEVIYSL